jgi:hypothetical protein
MPANRLLFRQSVQMCMFYKNAGKRCTQAIKPFAIKMWENVPACYYLCGLVSNRPYALHPYNNASTKLFSSSRVIKTGKNM